MKRILIASVFSIILVGLLAVPAMAVQPATSPNGAVVGEAADPLWADGGMIRYVGNNAGYAFWYTIQSTGISYHAVYKFEVNDPTQWDGVTTVPDREPYNLVATPGATAYYKINITKK